MINARDFGVLGDDSGALVTQWLPGGSIPLPGIDSIEELRTATGIADLATTDTIDWAAIMWASGVAQERPVFLPSGSYRLSRALTYQRGGIQGELVSAGSAQYRTRIALKAGVAADALIRINPGQSNRHFHFRNFVGGGGLHGIHGTGTDDSLEQHSVFENLYFTGQDQEGVFFDGLQLIGFPIRRIKVENAGTHGMRFRGKAMLNGAQIESCRMVRCKGHGFWFENNHAQSSTPGLTVSGCIAEYNNGCGMLIQGVQALLLAPYFEANNFDKIGDEPDLRLASSVAGSPSVHANVTVVAGSFNSPSIPAAPRIAGTAPHTQSLALFNPLGPLKVKGANLKLTVVPATGVVTVV